MKKFQLALVLAAALLPSAAFAEAIPQFHLVCPPTQEGLTPFAVTSIAYSAQDLKEMDPEYSKGLVADKVYWTLYFTPRNQEPLPVPMDKVVAKDGKYKMSLDLGDKNGGIEFSFDGKTTKLNVHVVEGHFLSPLNTNGVTTQYQCSGPEGVAEADCSEAGLKQRVADYVTSSLDKQMGESLVPGSLKISSDASKSHTSRDPEKDDVQTTMYASFDTIQKGQKKPQSFVAVLVFSHGSPLAEGQRCDLRSNIISGVEAQ